MNSKLCPNWPNTPLVFLDIDGVLNDHAFDEAAKSSTLIRPAVAHLNAILERTDARIVLSSAWRYMVIGKAMSVTGFDYLLRTHGVIANRLVSLTPADEEIAGRGWQVQNWRCEHGHNGPYVVIDDRDDHKTLSRLHGERFIQTDGERGLEAEHVELAVKLLGETERHHEQNSIDRLDKSASQGARMVLAERMEQANQDL